MRHLFVLICMFKEKKIKITTSVFFSLFKTLFIGTKLSLRDHYVPIIDQVLENIKISMLPSRYLNRTFENKSKCCPCNNAHDSIDTVGFPQRSYVILGNIQLHRCIFKAAISTI